MSCHEVKGCSPATAALRSSGDELPRELAAQVLELGHSFGDGRVRVGAQLERRAVGLGARVSGELSVKPRHHRVGARGERPVGGVEQHHLLLDPYGPGRHRGRPLRPQAGTGELDRRRHRVRRHAHRSPSVGRDPSRAETVAALDQALEQRELLGFVDERLGVPLDAQHELGARSSSNGLDHAVLRPCDRAQVERPGGRSPGGERS